MERAARRYLALSLFDLVPLSLSSAPPGPSITVCQHIDCFGVFIEQFATTYIRSLQVSVPRFRCVLYLGDSIRSLSCFLRLAQRSGWHLISLTDWIPSQHCVIAIEPAVLPLRLWQRSSAIESMLRRHWYCHTFGLTRSGMLHDFYLSTLLPTSTPACAFAALLRLCDMRTTCA